MIRTVEPPVDVNKPDLAPEVLQFAAAKGIDAYLEAAIDLARHAFPSSSLSITLGQDAEDETHKYIALDVEASGLTSQELLSGQRTWSAGMSRTCEPRFGVYFVLGWL
jgi:hypothetical protein